MINVRYNIYFLSFGFSIASALNRWIIFNSFGAINWRAQKKDRSIGHIFFVVFALDFCACKMVKWNVHSFGQSHQMKKTERMWVRLRWNFLLLTHLCGGRKCRLNNRIAQQFLPIPMLQSSNRKFIRSQTLYALPAYSWLYILLLFIMDALDEQKKTT